MKGSASGVELATVGAAETLSSSTKVATTVVPTAAALTVESGFSGPGTSWMLTVPAATWGPVKSKATGVWASALLPSLLRTVMSICRSPSSPGAPVTVKVQV